MSASFQEKKLPSTITVPSSSSYLNIDTRDQLKFDADGYIENPYQNPFDISIYKPDAIFQGRVLRMALTNFNMLWSCPNVNPYNDLLVLERISPTTGEVEQHRIQLSAIQRGQASINFAFYDPLQLAAAIQVYLLNTTGASTPEPLWGNINWTCKYESNRFVINNGDTAGDSVYNFRVNPMFGKNKGQTSVPDTGITYNITTTLAQMMGYYNASKLFTNIVKSDTPTMIYTRYIDVVSDELTSFQYTRDFSTSKTTGRNLIARIFLSENMSSKDNTIYNLDAANPPAQTGSSEDYNYLGSRPFTINWQPTNVKYMKWDPATNLSGLNIKILDEFGNLLFDDLPSTVIPANPENAATQSFAGSGSYCQMTFTVTEGDN